MNVDPGAYRPTNAVLYDVGPGALAAARTSPVLALTSTTAVVSLASATARSAAFCALQVERGLERLARFGRLT